MRTTNTYTIGNRKTTVKYDADQAEYQVLLSVDGKPVPAATYYTDDSDDAINTAKMMAVY